MSDDQIADLLITEAAIFDIFTGDLLRRPLAIKDGRIIGTRHCLAKETLALPGKILLPGFCDGHIHLESSQLTMPEFAAAAVVHGTTAVVADPHEIANVCGLEGPRYFLRTTPGDLLDLFLMAPSCVPATPFETAGSTLTADDIREMLSWPQVLGLGEMMNFPGVLAGDEQVLEKLQAAVGRPIDGHAPGLTGADLRRYIAAGPDSDHECTSLAEGQQKLAAGMWVMLREGSGSRNLATLAPILCGDSRHRCLLVSDDLEARDLLERGHLDHLSREAVKCGVTPLDAVRAVSLNVAARFGQSDRGALAPGYHADLVAVDDLAGFRVSDVIKSGLPVVREGRLLRPPAPAELALTNTVRVAALTPSHLRVPASGATARVHVIVAADGSLLTGRTIASLPVADGSVQCAPAEDILKLAVIERHGRGGYIGLGFIKGFCLTSGALASTVAHDSHNLIVLGCDDQSMLTAACAVIQTGGGQAVASGDELLALLPLPIAGLISDRPATEVAAANLRLERAAHYLGCRLSRPFSTLSFMALPVIPELKLTDQGLFDVSFFQHIPLLVQ
ncbi:MAG: adenine deaminase [Armatimonadota bacterium]